MNDRSATMAGVGVGAFGVSVTALATVLLFLVPRTFATTTARNAYIDTWSVPVMTVGEALLMVGVPLLSVVFAYVLVKKGHSGRKVVRGFVVGGIVFGLGAALFGEVSTFLLFDDPALGRSMVGHLFDVGERGGRVVGGAVLGVLCALVVER